jgi:hypothetical protein
MQPNQDKVLRDLVELNGEVGRVQTLLDLMLKERRAELEREAKEGA